MSTKYTNSPFVKPNLAAILAIPRNELPDTGSGIFPFLFDSSTGIVYRFNPDLTSNGLLPNGSSSAGRWQPFQPNTGWNIITGDFFAKAGRSYIAFNSGSEIVTFPPISEVVAGQSIRLFRRNGLFRINSNGATVIPFSVGSLVSPQSDSYGNLGYLKSISNTIIAEYVFNGNEWVFITGQDTLSP